MHLLEDHLVEWISTHHAGFGLPVMGEQGAESIHAKFNSFNKHVFGDTNFDSKAEKHNE